MDPLSTQLLRRLLSLGPLELALKQHVRSPAMLSHRLHHHVVDAQEAMPRLGIWWFSALDFTCSAVGMELNDSVPAHHDPLKP